MKKGDTIRGYRLLQDFTTAGAGQSRWAFASKGGEEFFIKEFLAPKYPTEDAPGSPETKKAKRQRCRHFEQRQKKIQEAIAEKCAPGGNLVYARDFFRNGSLYYKVTDKVDVSSLEPEDISDLPLKKRLLILLTVTNSLRILHRIGVVHADLKPDNILVKRTRTGAYAAKLIDFDDSFFPGNPPPPDEIVGDQAFYSPEFSEYVMEGGESAIRKKSDIFALGLVFSLYLTGEFPAYDESKYKYCCNAVADGNSLTLKGGVEDDDLFSFVNRMIQVDPETRPDTNEVFSTLKAFHRGDRAARPSPGGKTSESKGRLSGTLIGGKKDTGRKSSGKKEEDSGSSGRLGGTLID